MCKYRIEKSENKFIFVRILDDKVANLLKRKIIKLALNFQNEECALREADMINWELAKMFKEIERYKYQHEIDAAWKETNKKWRVIVKKIKKEKTTLKNSIEFSS